MKSRTIVLLAFGSLLLLVAVGAVAAVTTPGVMVANQAIVEGMVTIGRVDATEPSWVVIHTDEGGKPGPVIGYAHVEAGETKSLKVKIEAAKATPMLFAMLHADKGKIGIYEFPGPDVPVAVKGVMVNPSFKILAKAMADPIVTVKGMSFEPASLTVAPGTTVTWVNEDAAAHTVTADDDSFDSGNMDKGAKFSREFKKAGTYPYYCDYHGNKGGAGMAGTIIVKP